jgi:plasmid stabilization system protein ParE
MEVKWEPRAVVTLEAVIRYRYEVAGRRSAERLLSKIDADVARIATNPLCGSVIEGLEGLNDSYRWLVTGKIYKLVYRVEADVVYIATLFDCRREPTRLREDI